MFLIDTGMLSSENGGDPSALEIRGGRFTAYYANREPKVLVSPDSEGQVPALGLPTSVTPARR